MASGIGSTSRTNAMLLLFQNTAWANTGNAGGIQPSTVAGSFFVGLSTGTLAAGSTQTTTQAAYTSYTRVAVARSSAGWTSSTNQVSNAAAVTFPACTGGSETETDFTVGLITGTGAGDNLYWGALTASLAVSNGITPSFAIGALVCNLS
jgi:nucleoside phosphorylase